MQREIDFTDLIDWGREADLAVVTPSLPQCCMRLLDLLWFIVPQVFIISNQMSVICGAFPKVESENLSTVGNCSLPCTSWKKTTTKTTYFWLIIVETMNPTLHSQSDKVNQDN